MDVICDACNQRVRFDPRQYCCQCGGAWEPMVDEGLESTLIQSASQSVWRYAAFFGKDAFDRGVSLGAGWTKLIEADWSGQRTYFKLEYISPTGSFKDRGTEVEAAWLKAAGVDHVVEDSSGNAGASIAAFAARAGMHAEIYAPASAPQAKLDQIVIYGARLQKIPGPRIEATQAVLRAVQDGAIYATHAYNPAYLLGQQTFAWEIWEQCINGMPDAVVIPVGQGGLLMGAWLGFQRLVGSGLLDRMPRLFAAQPEVLAPYYQAFVGGMDTVPVLEAKVSSAADGLAITQPVRGKRVLQALRESGGGALTVTEDEIRQAYFQLARLGLFVEPTSAVAAAALKQIRIVLGSQARILVALTGSGMKTSLLVK